MSESAKLILVVDDDAMNRKLTTMFLKKLGYESRVAQSGPEALEIVKEGGFDIILMDYRMPEMDGVETTKLLRSMEGVYFRSVPVIALTGDERADVHQEFEAAGMQDVLSKPLDAEKLAVVLKRWLNAESSEKKERTKEKFEQRQECVQEQWMNVPDEKYTALQEAGIDAGEGIHNCGSCELWLSFLKDFYNLVDFKAAKLVKYLSEGQLKEYTIEVHALKNSARLIGALELSKDFGVLEAWGNGQDLQKIVERNPQIIEKMLQCKEVLKPYSKKEDREEQVVSDTQLKEVLWAMKAAVESFDIDGVDFCMEELEKYRISGCDKQMAKLKACVADVALEDITQIISEILGIVEKAE